MSPERVIVLGHVVERVPGGVAWSLSVGRLGARWGVLAVRTEDRWGGRDERLPQGPAEECTRCDGFERPKAADAYTKNLRSCTLCLVAAGAADLWDGRR